MLTTAGKNRIRNYFLGTGATQPTHMGFGTGTTAAVVGDTALQTEVFIDGAAREAYTSSTKPRARVTQHETIYHTVDGNVDAVAPAGTVYYTECGLFDASTGGNMFSRQVFSSLTKDNTLEFRWNVVLEVK